MDILTLGPFVGGINTSTDASAVSNTDLVDCVNFDLDLDGSLVRRPPILETAVAGWTERIVIVGRALIAGVSYLIGSNADGTYYSTNGTAWTLILANLKSKIALQYNNRVYVVATADSSVNGGYWTPGSGWTTDANMPRGESAVFHKARLFVVPGTSATSNTARLSFTDPILSATLSWPSVNFIDVHPGDGEALVEVVVYNDNLMLFKQDSTFVLAYDVNPSDAIVREVNPNIGASTRHCVASHENSLYVLHEGKVYEIVNYTFERLNLKTPFDGGSFYPPGQSGTSQIRLESVFLSVYLDRLLVRYYDNTYVFNLKTRVWTRWDSTNVRIRHFGPLVEMPKTSVSATAPVYYAGSAVEGYRYVYTFKEGQAEEFECSIKTKTYDLEDPHHYKKMLWWGADVDTVRTVDGTVYAIDRTNTYPVASSVPVADFASRQLIKFKKTLRFRQFYFELKMRTNGTEPVRLYSLSAIVGSKQTAGKEVN